MKTAVVIALVSLLGLLGGFGLAYQWMRWRP